MKRYYRYMSFLIMVTFLFSMSVNAEDCDINDLAKLKELANRVTIDTEFSGTRDNSTDYQEYTVRFSGLGNDFYFLFDNRIVLDGEPIYVVSGSNSFDIYSTKCSMVVRTINVDLPIFNEYSLYGECIGHEGDVDYCNPWYQGEVDEKIFDEDSTFFSDLEGNEDSDSVSTNLVNFVIDYRFFIIPGVIGIIFIIAFINSRRNRLD